MALFASPPRALNAFIYRSTDLNATPVVDISSLPADVYIKLYDTKAPLVGSTDPEMIFFVKAVTTSTLLIPDGFPFSVGISACAVTTSGTGGAVNPATAVTVTFVVRTG